jgi:hypothetical protein
VTSYWASVTLADGEVYGQGVRHRLEVIRTCLGFGRESGDDWE